MPDNPPAVGRPLDISYRLSWQKNDETRPDSGWTVQSRKGHGWAREPDGSIRMVVDFDGPRLRALKPDEKVLGALWLNDNDNESTIELASESCNWKISPVAA